MLSECSWHLLFLTSSGQDQTCARRGGILAHAPPGAYRLEVWRRCGVEVPECKYHTQVANQNSLAQKKACEWISKLGKMNLQTQVDLYHIFNKFISTHATLKVKMTYVDFSNYVEVVFVLSNLVPMSFCFFLWLAAVLERMRPQLTSAAIDCKLDEISMYVNNSVDKLASVSRCQTLSGILRGHARHCADAKKAR